MVGSRQWDLEERSTAASPACSPASRTSHGLANPGIDPIRYLRVAIVDQAETTGMPSAPGPLAAEWSPLEVDMLDAAKAHGGMGEIRFRRMWDHDRFTTGWGFIDHAVVEAGTSVGYHRHHTVQECYLILAGDGVMLVDGTVFGVAPGTGIPNRLGGAHGIEPTTNPSSSSTSHCSPRVTSTPSILVTTCRTVCEQWWHPIWGQIRSEIAHGAGCDSQRLPPNRADQRGRQVDAVGGERSSSSTRSSMPRGHRLVAIEVAHNVLDTSERLGHVAQKLDQVPDSGAAR